jgi:mitochondrial chaperone BCS1
MNIYILNLSIINKANLKHLFDSLPSRYIILLEDIDAVSSDRDAETVNSHHTATAPPSWMSKPVGGKVSLSSLLNVIDGVGSQEGRILIMTTNHITRLDEALIRPGHVDKKAELGLADNKMTADLFCLVFKPVQEDVQSGDHTKGSMKPQRPRELSGWQKGLSPRRRSWNTAQHKFSRFFLNTGHHRRKLLTM